MRRSASFWWLGLGIVTTALIGSSYSPAPAHAEQVVNLVPLIDPQRDHVAGVWNIVNGELVAEPHGFARLQIPYTPPADYDFTVRFTRVGKGESVSQFCPVVGSSVQWVMSAWNNRYFGFEKINGKRLTSNPSRIEGSLTSDVPHVSTVRVRGGRAEAYLDGRLVSTLPEGTATGPDVFWKLRNPGLLGVGTQHSRVVFHSIFLTEFTGGGHPVLPGAPPRIVAAPVVPPTVIVRPQPAAPAVNRGPALLGAWSVDYTPLSHGRGTEIVDTLSFAASPQHVMSSRAFGAAAYHASQHLREGVVVSEQFSATAALPNGHVHWAGHLAEGKLEGTVNITRDGHSIRYHFASVVAPGGTVIIQHERPHPSGEIVTHSPEPATVPSHGDAPTTAPAGTTIAQPRSGAAQPASPQPVPTTSRPTHPRKPITSPTRNQPVQSHPKTSPVRRPATPRQPDQPAN